MFYSGFDQESELEDLNELQEEWDEADYPPSGEPGFSPDASGYYSADDDLPDGYWPDDYSTDIYSSGDSSLGSLPKLLFVCTILACLILAAGLSLVTIQFPANDSQSAAQSNPLPAQNGTASQPQAAGDQPASSDDLSCSVSQRYPASIRRWCGLITQYASKHGLPPDLVAALIWQESGGNPVAYSGSGAVGLMQVMPSDGLAASFMCAAGPCFSTRPSTDELKNPEFNVSYGTRMLAGLVGRTGSLRDALKSYGPMDVGYYYADKVLGIYQNYRN